MNETGYGYLTPQDLADDYTALMFKINQRLARLRTITIVKVVTAPYGGTGVNPVGFLDAQPMVNMLDGSGNAMPHGTLYTLPYFRLQGGVTGAVICDPKVGDLGFALLCDRDISSVKQNRGQANPGSQRKHSLADGIYVGGILNGAPTTYFQFDGAGNIVVTTATGKTVNINGVIIDSSGNISAPGNVTADAGASHVDLVNHTHPGVTSGSSSTGAPNPGT